MRKTLLFIAILLTTFTITRAQSLSFDGVDDNVSVSNNASLKFSDAFTFEAWINITTYQYGTFVAKWDDDNNHRAWMINMGETGDNTKICVVLSDTVWSNFIQWNTGFTPNLNTWYHMAVTFDGTLASNNISLYINGVLQAQTSFPIILTPNTANLYLGGYDGPGNGFNAGANDRYLNGMMDEVHIDTVALSSAEIANNANCIYTPTTNLVANYNFNEGTANANNSGVTTLTDNTANGNDGTLNNFALIGDSSNWVGDALVKPTVTVSEKLMAITSSGDYIVNPAPNAFDGDSVYNGWGNNDILPAWLQVDFGAGNSKVLTGYSIYCSSQMIGGWNSNTYDPQAWTFQGFNGTKWDTLDTQVDPTPTQDVWKNYTFSNTTAYQMYRILISNTNDGGWAMITEMKLAPTPTFNVCSNKLFVAAPSNSAGTLQWQINGKNVGTNSDSLFLSSFNLNDTISCILSPTSACFAGNDSSNKVVLLEGPPVNTTTLSTNVITATQAGATYQWVDCNNSNAAIAGETNQSYTATSTGSYAVVITKGGCTDTSACVSVVITSVNSLNVQNRISVYPNPNNGICTIKATSQGVYSVKDELGQTVQLLSLNASNNYTATTENLNNGVYFIVGENNNKTLVQKIVVIK